VGILDQEESLPLHAQDLRHAVVNGVRPEMISKDQGDTAVLSSTARLVVRSCLMKINASMLHGLCGRIYKQHGIALLDAPDEHVRIERYYQVNRETLLRMAFDVSALETSQRKFAFEVKSNGYAASVLLQRLMTVNELAEPRKKRTTRKKGKRHDGQRTDPYDEVYSRLPDVYRPRVLIGIDPGMRNLCTAAIAGRLPRRTRKRSAWSKDLRRRNKKVRKRRHLRGQRIVEISTREYRHMAMMNKTSEWHKNLQKWEPWYAGICHAMLSFKTSNFELYFEPSVLLGSCWVPIGIHHRARLPQVPFPPGPHEDESFGRAGQAHRTGPKPSVVHCSRRLEQV
jgi:hypothetical protein